MGAKTVPLGSASASLPKASSTPLVEQAYSQLREALMEGAYGPGEPLVLQSLAIELNMSVMPVREAVIRLAAESALELTSGRSARVPTLDGDNFIELCEVRMLLEGRAAELAAVRARPEEIEAIASWNDRMKAAVTARYTEAALRCNREFHFSVYACAHQRLLGQMAERLWLRCGPYFRAVFANMTSPEGRRRGSLSHHDDVLMAIRARNPQKARQAIVDDIEESAEWFRTSVAKVPLGAKGPAQKKSTKASRN